jgi:pyruvate dehydrogenase E1 component
MAAAGHCGTPPLDVLEEVQRRVLWLATRMVDAANRSREKDEVKVGGHQSSSASMVTPMVALYFSHLDAGDRVSVKPHASPVFHAIQYLLGNLDKRYLTTLRAFGGLQSYPSRTKDPDRVDFSTGSVGLGAAAPLFAALVRRYVDQHFGTRPRNRFFAFTGDAELDEGNVWEAIADSATHGLGNVTWVIDVNRQSLDRVVPRIRTPQLEQMFAACGWHIVEVKYGRRLQAAFAGENGDVLRSYLDDMPNEQYQWYFRHTGAELRKRFCQDAPRGVEEALAHIADDDLAAVIQDLGGHDLAALLDAYRQADEVSEAPTAIFAYTVKGWGLPVAGDPLNHSALLTAGQIDVLRTRTGLTHETEWDRFDPESDAGRWCAMRHAHLARPEPSQILNIRVPDGVQTSHGKSVSTQEAFGRLMLGLYRDDAIAPYLVTAAPDVAVSTNLAGWINKVGVYSAANTPSWEDDTTLLRWHEHPRGQHIELGISEMNLFLLLGQLGLAWDISAQPLLPIGTVYDPFVCRGLDAFIYSVYSGARFIIAGTPSGVTLAPEGGAHQSTITPSIGTELPGVTFCEPAYAGSLDWLLCDAIRRIAAGEPDSSVYLRLSTRPIDNAPFEAARQRYGDEQLRMLVLSGGYRVLPSDAQGPVVHLVASGAVLPEVLAAAAELADEGIRAHVVDVTSLGRLYKLWRSTLRDGLRAARGPAVPPLLRELFPERGPIVTVHDAASHAMAWLGSALGVPCVPLGVDTFGQSGRIADLYREHDLAPGHIVNGALTALSVSRSHAVEG